MYDPKTDEVLDPFTCPDCRVKFGHARDCGEE